MNDSFSIKKIFILERKRKKITHPFFVLIPGGKLKKNVEQADDDEAVDDLADESAEALDTTTDEPASKSEKLEEATSVEPSESDNKATPKKKQRKKRNMVMGLEIPADTSLSNDNETPVRASRRIAQLRIKKEADKSRIEDEAQEVLDKKHHKASGKPLDKAAPGTATPEKKKRKKQKQESEEDAAMMKVSVH